MSRPFLLPVLGAALLAAFGLAAASTAKRARARTAERPPVAVAPVPAPAASPQPAAPVPPQPAARPSPGFTVERVSGSVGLRAHPGGKVVAQVGSTTQFGSPQTLTVAARRGGWLGLTSTDLPNGRLGWIRSTTPAIHPHRTKVWLRVDLSRRRLELLDGRRVLRRIAVGIGRPGSPTPTGRFSITDKLSGADYGPYYGCCILALSGHQTNTPAGWRGVDRLAIHGTDSPGTIGQAASAGCLRASDADLRALMRRVPLGTPLFVRP
jgi:lipoprotein-anchoring transpeptidase ErfK/SrfK